jgi:hypothetical protein
MTKESDALDVIYAEVTAADTEIDDAVESLLKEIHALRAERDTLRTFVFVSGRWVKKYCPRNGVPTPEALKDFAELTEAYNALPKVQP